PIEGPTAPTSPLARPFIENAFRLLELAVDDSATEAARVSERLKGRIVAAKDNPSGMVAFGPQTRTVDQVLAAGAALQEPKQAAIHALFFTWVPELPSDPQVVPRSLAELQQLLQGLATPERLLKPIAPLILPPQSSPEEEEAEEELTGGVLFPGD